MNASKFNRLVAETLSDRFSNTDARKRLGDAIEAAPWGGNGCLFITDNSHWPHSGGSTRRVWLNRRLVATLNEGEVYLTSPSEGEELFQARKSRNRLDEQKRQAARAACIASIERHGVITPRSHGEWTFQSGQEGGTFYSPQWGWVSAPGALRGAIRASHPAERSYDRSLYGARW